MSKLILDCDGDSSSVAAGQLSLYGTEVTADKDLSWSHACGLFCFVILPHTDSSGKDVSICNGAFSPSKLKEKQVVFPVVSLTANAELF